MRKNKLLLLLALLLTAATGAWAQTETPLLTIESTDYTSFRSGSMTFDDKVTVTFSNPVTNTGNTRGWYANPTASLLTVAGTNGYTITSCKFYAETGAAMTGYTVEGESPSVYVYAKKVFTDANQSVEIGQRGIMKIEVFGAAASAGYTVSLKDGVKDADKWTVKVGEGQAQALPIGGLTGDGSETVTLQYTGRLKVKGVKATSDAAPAAVPVTAITLNKTETSIKVGATETLSVTSVLPEEATDKTYTWKTSDESKATVDQDGKVTAVAAGTVTIYAEANDGSGVKGNCAVTVTPATITVTINQSDWGSGYSDSFTKDGVTVSAGLIDSQDGNLMEDGTFSTTLGNFTKIVVTTFSCRASGTGWSGSGSSMTWAGTPASTVSFSGNFMGRGRTQTTIVCTIEPAN